MAIKKLIALREKSAGNVEKPFLDHLEDLRGTVFKIALTLAAGVIGSFFFRHELANFLQAPLIAIDESFAHPRAIGPADSVLISFKLAFYAGLILTFPLNLYFIAQFILPGLSYKERRAVLPAVALGFALFLFGVSFAYYFVLPRALDFFYQDATGLGWKPDWTVQLYYSFVTQFTLIFGLGFELPVVVMLLVKLGLLHYEVMAQTRSYAIVLIMVVAALITPTHDLLTLFSLSLPMIILYEICIWLARFMARNENGPGDEKSGLPPSKW